MKNKIITFLVVLLFLANGFLLYKTNSLEKRLDEYSSITISNNNIHDFEVDINSKLELITNRLEDIESQYDMQNSYLNYLSDQINFD